MNALGNLAILIVFGPIAVLVLGIGGCEATKAYYDWQVKEMCSKDGGITIHEHIRISSLQQSRMRRVGGHLAIAEEAVAQKNDIVFLRRRATVLREGEPSVHRVEQQIVRRVDEKVVALVVRYSRSGGDFPFTGSSPSQFSCPDWPQYYKEIAKVFAVDGDMK